MARSAYDSFLTPTDDASRFFQPQQGGADSGYPSYSDRAAYARSLGYTVNGSDVITGTTHGGAMGGGAPFIAPLSAFSPPATGQGRRNGVSSDDLLAAAGRDISAQQGAANRQFERNQGQIDAFGQFVGGITDAFGKVTGQNAEALGGVIGGAQDLAARQRGDFEAGAKGVQDSVNAGVNKVQGDVTAANADIDKGYDLGDKMVADYKQAIANYKDTGAQDASAAALGIRRNAQAQMQQASSGVLPDGTMMTPAMQADAMERIRTDTEQNVQSAITPLLSHHNDVVAQMEGTLASLENQNANMRLQGADLKQKGASLELEGEQIKAQTGLTLSQQRLQQQQGERDLFNLSAGLEQFMANMRSTATLNSISLEMQGRTDMAKLVQENPETVVSVFNSLMAMYSLNNAQQANQRQGSGGITQPGAQQQREGSRNMGGFAGAGIGGQSPIGAGGNYANGGGNGGFPSQTDGYGPPKNYRGAPPPETSAPTYGMDQGPDTNGGYPLDENGNLMPNDQYQGSF